jgi:hypothetical protein
LGGLLGGFDFGESCRKASVDEYGNTREAWQRLEKQLKPLLTEFRGAQPE